MHIGQVLWFTIAAILLLVSRTDKLTAKVWIVELVAGCALDYHTSERALALARPGADYVRLWPLPVTQPWKEPQEPNLSRDRCLEREVGHRLDADSGLTCGIILSISQRIVSS
jgi:hypothetical protein